MRRNASKEDEEILVGGFKPWQEVVAATAEMKSSVTGKVMVAFGGKGLIIERMQGNEDRITVKFDERLDGLEFCVNALPRELMPQLPPGFGVSIGQRLSGTESAILNRESSDSEKCDSNRVIPRSL